MLHAQLVYLGLAFVLNLCTKNVCSDIKKNQPCIYWYIKDIPGNVSHMSNAFYLFPISFQKQ